jgi:uncharacterized protein (TIGR02246 family)
MYKAVKLSVLALLAITICVLFPDEAYAQKLSTKQQANLELEIGAMGRAYSAMIQKNDASAIENILADDYLVADQEGKVLTKAQDLATYKDRLTRVKIEKVEYLDQKVRIITPDVAIDHATIRFVGTSNGKPFNIVERCTTTWAKRKGKWMIVADHFSYVKDAK